MFETLEALFVRAAMTAGVRKKGEEARNNSCF